MQHLKLGKLKFRIRKMSWPRYKSQWQFHVTLIFKALDFSKYYFNKQQPYLKAQSKLNWEPMSSIGKMVLLRRCGLSLGIPNMDFVTLFISKINRNQWKMVGMICCTFLSINTIKLFSFMRKMICQQKARPCLYWTI